MSLTKYHTLWFNTGFLLNWQYTVDENTLFIFQINKSREKYFGWVLDDKYDVKSLENYHSLKGKDQFIGNYLDQANKSLPEEEQYDFYVVKYERVLSEAGRDRGGVFYGMY